MSEVVGRNLELVSIRSFVASAADGAAALVLEGEAGMGKTTLWDAALRMAADAGFQVLRARPSESETTLSFSGIGDLLDPILESALDCLPSAQRRALTRALVLDDDEGAAPDPHAVGVAVLGVLRELAGKSSLIVAVDDVQWLDPASSGALTYAARRLGPESVGLLVARRTPLESALVSELRRCLGDRFEDVEVGPLDVGALHRVVQNHLGAVLPRPLLAEVHGAAGGNPFYALEIVRTLRRTGVSVEAGQPLPVPESLHDLVHGRLLALPSESREYLLAAASYAHPTLHVTEEASGIRREAGLTPALGAGIVELDGSRIRFTHPLLAAGAYEIADPLRRIEVHRRLAELLTDPEARAWQLAAVVDEPEETVAAALEEAAAHARARGALRPAALLLDRAHEVTPPHDADSALRRGVEAAYVHFQSGDTPRAEAQIEGLIAPLAPGLPRARAMWVLARIRTYDAPADAAEMFLRVVDEADGDLQLLAAAHEGVASSLYYALERLEESERHADAARGLARELGDRALEADVLISKLGAQALLGDPAAGRTADEAYALQEEAADRRILDQPLLAVAEYWVLVDRHEQAREASLALLREADERGEESARPFLLSVLVRAELALGYLVDALEHARDGRAAAEQAGEAVFAGYNRVLEALAHAQLGDRDLARRTAQEALGRARSRFEELVAAAALGHVELAAGAPEEALSSLELAFELARREAIAEPGALRFVVDHVEALVELGRRADAAELLDWYEGNARRLQRTSALAACLRCRGLLAAGDGRLDAAVAAFEEALAVHAQAELPLERGRTLLALGATQRRAKRRRDARGTLNEALALFERIGAALWADRARAELRRISGRAATPGALTPAEEQVAVLVAEGKTNREVAAALFLSERTVEGHLSRAFAKLGVRHRGEVARALAAVQTQGIAVSNTGDAPVSAKPAAP